ncbi:MAG TPA: PLP-dependent aspartate aminotransferase family protein [Desulfosporosinus sp.]|nr:PLP-dependent aspartate aminotransferase family protein [Desulfosporosinus sp.]
MLKGKAFNTRLLHAAADRDPFTGAVSIPIYQVSTFHQDPDKPGDYDYSRSGNPTRKALEDLIAQLEGGVRGFAFASGMAATSSVLMLFQPGDHLVVSEDLYGGSFRVLTTVFDRWGLKISFVDSSDSEAVEKAITPSTKALFIETPSNPLLKISDLRELVKIAQRHNLITIADNTFLTPYLCRPLELGVDIVIHSATKFLNGHSDVLAGLVVAKDQEFADKIGFLQNALGGVLGPQDSWLLIRGLKTLGIRLDRQSANAQIMANWFQTQPWVEKVYYPGLESHPGRQVLSEIASGFGAIVSFKVKEPEILDKLVRNLTLPAVAVSLGAVESILTHPVTMSHAAMAPAQRDKLGISNNLLRLSVGLEDTFDLIDDFLKAIK